MSTALGSVYGDGVRRSARLNRDVIQKLVDSDITNDVAATVADVESLLSTLVKPTAGKSRSKKGGSKTSEAVTKFLVDMKAGGGAVVDGLDGVVSSVISWGPAMLTGTVVSAAINNPTVFSTLISAIHNVGVAYIAANTGATWIDYSDAFKSLAVTGTQLAKDIVALPTNSPYAAFLLATAVMKYRAGGGSIQDVILSDAAAVLGAAKTASMSLFSTGALIITGQIQAYNDALSKEAVKLSTATIREIGSRVGKTPGKGSEAMSQAFGATGAPSAQSGDMMGEERATRLVPASSTRASNPAAPLRKVRGREPEINPRAAADATAAEEDAAAPDGMDVEGAEALAALKGDSKKPKTEGGRRRKTKKRVMKKRRMTRRKLTFSY